VPTAEAAEAPKLNKKQRRAEKRKAREATAKGEAKGTRKGAAKSEKKEVKRDKERIQKFTGENAAKDSMYAVLAGCVEKKAEDLSQIERTALALTLIPVNTTTEWKPLIEVYNSRVINEAMTASTRSDGTTGPKGDSVKGFNLRNQLFNAEHKEKNPLRIIRGQKYANTHAHSHDNILRSRLEGFTLMPSTFKMLGESAELIGKLHKRFFKTSRAKKSEVTEQ
jgi:hypothetical protein